jgi:hypothetical protein
MAHVYEQSVWSSGNSRERSADLHKSMTVTKRSFCQELFPKIQKDDAKKDEKTGEEAPEAESLAPSPAPAESQDKESDLMEGALTKYGYAKDLLGEAGFREAFTKALSRKGEIISSRTGKLWVERAIPEEPPASIFPDKLKLGDRVQVLNWVPMGVHGAKIDLFPEGKVSKIYKVKCLVTKEPIPFGVIPGDDAEFSEEERVIGLELDGKGPYVEKGGKGTPFPYVTKDSTVIMRFPPMADPSGNTDHTSPGLM